MSADLKSNVQKSTASGARGRAARMKVDPALRAKLMRRVTRLSVAVALFLVVIKVWAWLETGSVALLGSLFDSFLDALASAVMLLAVSHALMPADSDHRFGHGKVEAIAGLGQAAIIIGSSLFLFVEAVGHFLEPQLPSHSRIGIGVIVLSIILTLALVRYQRYVIARTGSLAVTADSLHYVGDLLMNAGIILAFMVVEIWAWPYADPIMGLIIAVILIRSAWTIARQSYDTLMDKEMGEEERARIEAIVLAYPEIRGIHDLRTRTSGIHSFIQFHIELDPQLKLTRAHHISDRVELAVARAFPSADIIIHADPAGDEEPHEVTEDGLGPSTGKEMT